MRFKSQWLDPSTPLKWNWNREVSKQKWFTERYKNTFGRTYRANFGTSNRFRGNNYDNDRLAANRTPQAAALSWAAPWNEHKRLYKLHRKLRLGDTLTVDTTPIFGVSEVDRLVVNIKQVASSHQTLLVRPAAEAARRNASNPIPVMGAINPAVCWWCGTARDQWSEVLLPPSLNASSDSLDALRAFGASREALSQLSPAVVVGLSPKAFMSLLLSWPVLGVRDATLEGALIVGFGDQVMAMPPLEFLQCLRAITTMGVVKAVELGEHDWRGSLGRHCATAFARERAYERCIAAAAYHAHRSPDRLMELLSTVAMFSGRRGFCSDGQQRSRRLVRGVDAASEAKDDPDGVSGPFMTLQYEGGLTLDVVQRLKATTSTVLGLELVAPAVAKLLQVDNNTKDVQSRVTLVRQIAALELVEGLLRRFDELIHVELDSAPSSAAWDCLGIVCLASAVLPLIRPVVGSSRAAAAKELVAVKAEPSSLTVADSSVVSRAVRDAHGRILESPALVPVEVLDKLDRKRGRCTTSTRDGAVPQGAVEEIRASIRRKLSHALDVAARGVIAHHSHPIAHHVAVEAIQTLERCCDDFGVTSASMVALRQGLRNLLATELCSPRGAATQPQRLPLRV